MGRKKQRGGISEIIHQYQNGAANKFKPENFQEIPRLFGQEAAIDMNRLVCQHQQHVASAYMRRLRRDKIKQRDVYFQKLQNIPLHIRRMAVGPNYMDPYSSFKQRLPKLGQDDRIKKTESPTLPADEASPYVPHNSLSPHLNVLFKMNPGATPNMTNNNIPMKGGKKTQVEDDLPFHLSPRRPKLPLANSYVPTIKKRISVEADVGRSDLDVSVDNSPRCPTNTPRNAAFWSFNIPNELNHGQKKSHISSIPRAKEAMAAINSVQKHNKPLPAIVTKA